jgi:hypothetical protein
MPVDTNLLYGEMAGSWLLHLAIPIGVSVFISSLPYMPLATKALMFIGLTAILSGLVQTAFLLALQASACSGVKDYGSIFVAASVGALITAGMVALPVYVTPLRLAVSQLFGTHKSLLTPAMQRINEIISEAGSGVSTATVSADVEKATGRIVVQGGGAALTPPEYEAQEFKEMMIGASYWAAFAGAYGIGVGSMMATSCPASN